MIILMSILGILNLVFLVDCIFFRIKYQTEEKILISNNNYLIIFGAASFIFLLFSIVCVLSNYELKEKLDKLNNEIKNSKYEIIQEPLYRKKCIKK